jgi:16S rRNA (uracil1498-N3)-methyltransferase
LHVVRIRPNEEILVLNGNGVKALTKVGEISKNQIELLVESIVESIPLHEISLAIAVPKKEAFEDILKIAVELGVQNIYPLTSEFSQYEYLESERIQRILESALIQSNNPFLPTIHSQVSLDHFLGELKTPLYFFNSKPDDCGKEQKISGKKTILIGAEGGFSPREVASILAKPNTFSIHLPTPIMRAPTAVATSIGYLISST